MELLSRQKEAGVNLGSLHYANKFATVDADLILDCSPRLKDLSIECCYLVKSKSAETAVRLLEELFLRSQAPIPYPVWSELLVTCPQLTDFHVTSCKEMTDETLEKLLSADKKIQVGKRLKRFLVRGGPYLANRIQLTKRSYHNLVANCPQLEEVGDCAAWSSWSGAGKELL